MTYQELDILASKISELVTPRKLVFCLCRNTMGSVAGYVALMQNGNVPLLLDAQMDETAFDELVDTYRPAYIWGPKRNVDENEDGEKREKVLEAEGYVLWKRRDEGPAVADELSLLMTTSGSTGSPKLVRLSKKNLKSNTKAIIEYLEITDKERPITSLPMYYAFGLSVLNAHLAVGATLLLTEDSFASQEFWQFAKEKKFTSFAGVPYMFEIIQKLGIWKQEMPSLRTLTQAGGKMSDALSQFFQEEFAPRGVKLYTMYGLTEATARVSFLDPDFSQSKLGSIGQGITGEILFIVDKNKREITDVNIVGELVIKGPNISLGYAERASDLTKGDENEGVLFTGDMAYRDEDGFYYIIGRKGRFVKPYGVRVSLDHLETLLQPMLMECSCVGNDTQIVVFTPDTICDDASIIDFLATRTKLVRTIFSVRRLPALPRLKNGKIRYGLLSNILSERTKITDDEAKNRTDSKRQHQRD